MSEIKMTDEVKKGMKRPAQMALLKDGGRYYGAIYLDEGEGFDLAKTQIDFLKENKADKIYFDIMIGDNQGKEGKEMVDKIFEYIEAQGMEADVELCFSSLIGENPRN